MKTVIVAPFSNSAIRDWPIENFSLLIALLLERMPDIGVHVVGVKSQKLAAREIVRPHPADRVQNQCGLLEWSQLLQRVRSADCVIGNNSGISHLAAFLGAPTVCVFGGSHQRMEWHPKGPNVVIVSRALACSPCQLDHNHVSPYGKACLRGIEPQVVAEAAAGMMAGTLDVSGAPRREGSMACFS
jgi:ADP-heptose:LPS heptosyltransferase